jgi:hypothetical protein
MRKDRDGNYLVAMDFQMLEVFGDTKGVMIICITKKNRKRNGQKKSTKEQTMTYKTYI